MDIDLELFRIFDTVATVRSFSSAAEELKISQPAVSQAVRRMEEQLGARLFERGHRGVSLTQEGDTIYSYVHTALRMIGTGVERALERNALRDTHLRIAAGDSAAKWYLAPLIREFASQYPNVVIRVLAGKTSDTLTLLQERKADIGFVNMPISADGVIFEECFTLHDVFIAGKEYENLKNRTVSLQELTTYPLIMLDGSCRTRKWVDRHFNAHGAMILSSLVLSSQELMPEYVRSGLGIACVVDEFSRQTLSSGDVFRVELEDPVPERSLGICFRSDGPLSPSAERFIDLAKRRS